MGICSDTLKTLGFTRIESQVKRPRAYSESSVLTSRIPSGGGSGNSENYGDKDNSVKKRHKLVRLKNLKNGGTTVKNDKGNYEYHYVASEIITNPFKTKCVSRDKGYSVELQMDTPPDKVVVLPDLPVQYSEIVSSRRASSSNSTVPLFENSSTTSIPNVRIASETTTNGGVILSGKVLVRSLNAQTPQRLRHQSISLKCFVEEYAYFIENGSDGHVKNKQIRLVNKKDGDDITHLLPYKELKLDLTDMVDPESTDGDRWLQPNCTYELPFSFTLKPYEFPASVQTYFGSTHFRVESMTQVGDYGDGIDTSFLTDLVLLKRVLPTTSDIKYESVQIQGEWNNELNYDIALSNKMIEIGKPFDIQIGLLRGSSSRIRVESISVSLTQVLAIPCINSKSGKPLSSSYLKKNEFQVYKKLVQNQNRPYSNPDAMALSKWASTPFSYSRNNYNGFAGVPCARDNNDDNNNPLCTHQMNHLILDEKAMSWLRPFYCELSNNCRGRARLKITHVINVRLTLSNTTSSQNRVTDVTPTHLTFKIPVLVVDHDMAMNLWLPPYDHRRIDNDNNDKLSPPNYFSVI